MRALELELNKSMGKEHRGEQEIGKAKEGHWKWTRFQIKVMALAGY